MYMYVVCAARLSTWVIIITVYVYKLIVFVYNMCPCALFGC